MQRTIVLLAIGSLAFSPNLLKADTVNPLGSASAFAILGAATVTNTGPSVLSGDLGVSPGTAITGFPPGIVINGATHDNDGVAIQAQADALAGYNALAALSPTATLTGQDLGGLTLNSGVYFYSSSAQLTGDLTIDFQGLDNADAVFQIGTALTTASGSKVNIINAGANDNIFWQVGSSATLGTTTAFMGSIIADQSISLNTGATINCGSAIALVGAVTLDTNTVNVCSTSGDTGGTGGDGGGSISAVPEPESLVLLSTGLLGIGAAVRRLKQTASR